MQALTARQATAEGKIASEQAELQKGYAGASEELQKFGSTAGKKATALDRVDQDKFANDAAGLSAHYFRSQQSVRDLKELTGKPELVAKLARDHVSQELAGKSSNQVAAWARKNADWTREVPGLPKAVSDYAAKVAKAERIGQKLDARVGELKGQREGVLTQAEREAAKARAQGLDEASKRTASRVEEQQKIVQSAQEKAEAVRKATVGRIESVIKDGYPAEAVRKLLIGGTPEQHQLAMEYLERSPGGRGAMVDVTRRVLSDASPKQVGVLWGERLRPMLEASGVEPGVVAEIESKVQDLVRAGNGPEEEKLRVSITRRLTASLVGQTAARWQTGQ